MPFVRAERGHQNVPPARVHAKANAPQSGHYIGRLHFAIDGQSPDAAALFIVEHVLGRHPVASRLGQRLREAEGLTYGVRSSIRVARHDDAGRIAVEGTYPAGHGARLADIVKEEVARLARQGMTDQELERARRTILQERQRALGQDVTVLSLLPAQLQDGLTMQEWVERNDAFAAVTLEQVNAVAGRYLDAARLVEIYADGSGPETVELNQAK
ncbi:MAG: insulinase family protein [Pseudorhodoferax sp.]